MKLTTIEQQKKVDKLGKEIRFSMQMSIEAEATRQALEDIGNIYEEIDCILWND